MLAKLRALKARIPARLRSEAVHVAITFVAAFAAVAAPVAPSLLHTPDFKTAKALVVATLAGAIAAGIRAAKPQLLKDVKDWLKAQLSKLTSNSQPPPAAK